MENKTWTVMLECPVVDACTPEEAERVVRSKLAAGWVPQTCEALEVRPAREGRPDECWTNYVGIVREALRGAREEYLDPDERCPGCGSRNRHCQCRRED